MTRRLVYEVMCSVSGDRKRKLDKTMAELQDRWGSAAVRRLGQMQRGSVPHVPTGFPALDKALAIGGLPSGRITEIVGIPTSGMATLTLTIAARAQKRSGIIVYIDLGHNFDPEFAVQCGLDLNHLVLVRPQDGYQALHVLQDFVAGGGIAALVFDGDPVYFEDSQAAMALAATLNKIIAPLSQSTCLLLFLTSLSPSSSSPDSTASKSTANGYPNGSIIPHHAAVRLHLQHVKWLYKEGDISGYNARIIVAKNKLGPAGKQVSFSIQYRELNHFETLTTTAIDHPPPRLRAERSLIEGAAT
jgi:recombination protein RecA